MDVKSLERHFLQVLLRISCSDSIECFCHAGCAFLTREALLNEETAKTAATEEGARTLDHKVKSLALYQLSYSGPVLGLTKPWEYQSELDRVTSAGKSNFAVYIRCSNRQHGIPEMAAFGVMTFLCKHPCQEVDNKKHPVALMAPPYVLTVVAARTCAQVHN